MNIQPQPAGTCSRQGWKIFFQDDFCATATCRHWWATYSPRQYVLPEAEAHIVEVDAGKIDGGIAKPAESALRPGDGEAARRLRRFQKYFGLIKIASGFPGKKTTERSSAPVNSNGETAFAEAEANAHSRGASYVLCHCHWQANANQCLTILLVHGLEGSSCSQYVLGNAARAWAAGCNVVRMNMRNCGGTENLSPTLYHSALSADVAAVMRALAAEKGLGAFALVGYSMGGNLVLKLAGELGEETPQYLKAVVGVSPAMDLAASADAHAQRFQPRLRMEIPKRPAPALSVKGTALSSHLFHPRTGEDCILAPIRRPDHRALLRLSRGG